MKIDTQELIVLLEGTSPELAEKLKLRIVGTLMAADDMATALKDLLRQLAIRDPKIANMVHDTLMK